MHVQPCRRILDKLAITTAVSAGSDILEDAERLAVSLNAALISRTGRSINSFFDDQICDRLLVVQRDNYMLHDSRGQQYQFHPNMSVVRALNHTKTGRDYYLTACDLRPGDTVINCTLGFGCEALLASLVVGADGEVIGLESVPELAVLTRDGMSRYHMLQRNLQEAMRRVVVLNADYRTYLQRSLTKSADIVYFDPFFKETLDGGLQTVGSLAAFGNRSPLDTKSVLEARRVARRSVIIKHPKWHLLPSELAPLVKEEIGGKKSTISFAVIPPFAV